MGKLLIEFKKVEIKCLKHGSTYVIDEPLELPEDAIFVKFERHYIRQRGYWAIYLLPIYADT